MKSPGNRLAALALAGLLLLGWLTWRWRPVRVHALAATAAAPADAAARTAAVAPAAGDARFAAPVDEAARRAQLLAQVAALSAEFERLRALPDDIENLRRSAELENEFAALLDADTAALLVREMPAGFVDSHFGVIALRRWAEAERAIAAAWMAAHPGTTAVAAEALARGWLVADRAALEAHLAQLSATPWRTHVAVIVAEDAFLAKDAPGVLALLDRAAVDDPRRTQLAEWNATAWAIRDAEAAAAWAAREPDPARREALSAAVAIGEANTDPVAAVQRLFRTVSQPAALTPAVNAIVRLWATRAPAEAQAWVAAMPAGPLRAAAEENLRAILKPDFPTGS